MDVKIKKLNSSAVIPTYAHVTDAGMDLTAVSVDYTNPYYIEYGTGIAMEIPEGYVGLIFPRSSNSKKDLLLCNSVGVIDSGYRGEIKLRFKKIWNTANIELSRYEVGNRVGQIVIVPYPKINLIEVNNLEDSDRGIGGFGHSGK